MNTALQMKIIVVAVGSTRRPKLNAVSDALAAIGDLLDAGTRYEIRGVSVASGVRHTPLSRADLMAGARNRAEALRELAEKTQEPWEYFVGLEGGFDVVYEGEKRCVFLESWAYVLDRSGRGAFGQSGAVMVPEPLSRTVVDEGVELAAAVDGFTGERGIRDAQGAWGVFTRDLVTRQDSFRAAVIHAFAPFYNASIYQAAGAKTSRG
ncbi:MAG TPA: inosine/xanthosine triphosphatase [Candidatus Acidoferrales bacterium]|nr:inosine/xanthosine triphosphatase [Candidatus Acidoferrales bacterium]